MLVPVVHALEPEALTSVASNVLLPKEYRANDRLIDPAPSLVAGNAMANAMSTSDNAIGAARTMRARYKELANCVPIVPVALVTGRATNCKGTCCVRLSRDIAGLRFEITMAPFAPLVERLMPGPADRLAPTVRVLALVEKVIPLPATKDTLPVEAFKLNAAAVPAAGPIMVMLDMPEFSVMLAPATSES